MADKLQKDFLSLKEKCAALDKKGYVIRDKGSIEEYFKISLMKMLIYISTLDERITKNETEFISSALGIGLNTNDTSELTRIKKMITPDSITDSLQRVVKVFIDAQSDGEDADYKAINTFVNDLGVGFMAADGAADDRETAFLSRLVYRLRVFGESYVRGIKNSGGLKSRPAPAKEKAETAAKADNDKKAEPEKKEEDSSTLEELLEKLDTLIGLMSVKQEVYSLANLIKVRKLREERGFKQPEMSLHLVFTGNPGTGKTTVARLLAKIYHRLGAVREDNFVEVDRSGLVSNFIGHTAIKTREVCESALGGVLFIDEAYALTNKTGQNDYGIEAVNTLLKFMEDNRGDIVVICAGYTDLMEEFLNSNPGLRSRFNRFIEFQDYTANELRQMFELYLRQYSLKAGEGVLEYVEGFFEERIKNKTEYFANGRDARNFFEKALSNQADRLADVGEMTDDELMTLTVDDVKGVEL
ncbi:MAG: AAA family ATPase [Ruminococcus sp.]|nr:AAA family ATPase [Ruminococcus sp.]